MVKTLTQILESLTPVDREAINYAFQSGMPYFIELPDSEYIGVNIEDIKKLVPETTIGVWSLGRIQLD